MTHQEKIDSIMDWFDFDKVALAMQALNWEWADAVECVPSEGEIREHGRQRLKEAIERGMSSTGGFKAIYKDGVLSLEFILADGETGDE